MNSVKNQVWDQVGDQVWHQVRGPVWGQVRYQVGDRVERALPRDQVWTALIDNVLSDQYDT